ncbi:MAG TPA: lauroyl acyltransferase [Acetobacteraceae bacterium]|nr:lauroyl acyltransferase [Acetobacteraceae bacterium]
MTRLLHAIETALVRAALAVLRRLGPAASSNLGGAIARALGPLLPVSAVARANLRLALPELGAAAHRRILRGVWDNLGRTVAELPHLGALGPTETGPGWEIEGAEHLQALAARGGPAILFSGHIGNWEMLPRVVAAFGIAMSSLYRPPDNRAVDAILRDLRRAAIGTDVRLFPKGAAGARAAFGHLARGGYLGLLIDQKLNDGIAVEFFGRRAMTAPSLAALALRFRCPVIPGHILRLGPARFRLVVEPPLPLPDSGDRDADILALTRSVNATLERWIRARPEGWLWLHRRWPRAGV